MHPNPLTTSEVLDIVCRSCPPEDYRDKRVLLIVPDGTRTAPIGLIFQALFGQIGQITKSFDVLIALGTHQPMSEAAICRRLEISETDRRETFSRVKFFNHAWDKPSALRQIGVLSAEEVSELSGGLFSIDVPVEINQFLFDYDHITIILPVF